MTEPGISAIVPCFTYADAPAAIDFLCTAFGFEKHFVHEGTDRAVEHAQLKLGAHFIMLGSARKHGDEWPSRTPGELGGVTGGTYIVLESDEDVDGVYARAKAAGARIMIELRSPEYGGRTFSAADPEGYLWSFGSYRP